MYIIYYTMQLFELLTLITTVYIQRDIQSCKRTLKTLNAFSLFPTVLLQKTVITEYAIKYASLQPDSGALSLAYYIVHPVRVYRHYFVCIGTRKTQYNTILYYTVELAYNIYIQNTQNDVWWFNLFFIFCSVLIFGDLLRIWWLGIVVNCR